MTKKRAFVSLIILIILIICLVITVYIAVNKKPKSYQSKAYETMLEASASAQFLKFSGEMDEKNAFFLKLLEQYNAAGEEEDKQSSYTMLIAKAKERKQTLLSLLKLSPYAVYQKAFDNQTLDQFPMEVQALLEKRINNIQGNVRILHEDNFIQNASRETFFFADKTNPGKDYFFYPTTASSYPYNPLPFSSGTEVIIKKGLVIDGEKQNSSTVSHLSRQIAFINLARAEEQETAQIQSYLVSVEMETLSTDKPDSLGIQNLLVLLARYNDVKETDIPSPDEIEASFKKIQDFYDKNSYGRFSLVPEIVKKWYTLERPKVQTSLVFKSTLEFDYIYKNVLTQAYTDNEEIEKYKNQRFVIVVADDVNFKSGEAYIGKSSVVQIKDNNNKTISLGKTSHSIVYFSTTDRSNFYESKPTADGSFSAFEKMVIHELGHAIGARHAWGVFCKNNHFLPTSFSIAYRQTLFDNEMGLSFIRYIQKHCTTGEYENSFDAMGNGFKGTYFNAYIKKYFDWIGDESNGKYVRIDPAKPEGIYSLKLMGENGVVAVWFPFAEANPEDFLRVDYFLEYRKRALNDHWDEKGLAINIETLRTPPVLQSTFLFAPPTNNNLFQKGEYFIDNWNNVCIKVKNINKEESSLTFEVASRGQEKTFHLIPSRAGNDNSASINVFESDLQNNDQKSIKIIERFTTENQSLCDEKKYRVDKNSISIRQGMLAVLTPVFDEDTTVKPKSFLDRFFSTAIRFNALVPNDTTLSFSLSELPADINSQGPFISQSLKYIFHLVPSPEENKNDLEPYLITFSDDKGKEINHLELEKGNVIVMKSNIANNSRNPNDNKSSNFIMKWYIQDEKGKDIVSQTQRHDGILPKSIDDAHPALLTWTIPQDLSTGDYKIIVEVDSNNRLQEFNENNNMIWRYFSVME